MEFLKRKHFSLWITLLVAAIVDSGYGLQGVPTWMCLGIKSPFIEFKNEIEILANTSVFLNITKDEQVLMHEEELQKLGTFIKPVDLRNSSTGYVKSDLTKKLPPASASRRKGVTENPIVEEMDRKEIELLEEEIDPNTGFPGLNNEDRKFIVPMALKNPANEPKKAPPPVNDFSTNIDDLKNHILMLQNMTKNDKNFKSKFVVFPSLQRDKNGTQAKSQALAYTAQPPPKKPIYGDTEMPEASRSKLIDVDDHHDDLPREKITIIPQVLLLNDQTPPDDEDDRRPNEDRKETRVTYSRRRNFRKTSTSTTTTTTTTTMAPARPSRRNPKRQRGGAGGERRNRKRQQNCKNLDTPRCQRQRRRQQLALSLNVNKTLSPVSMEGSQFSDSRNKTSSSLETDFWMGGNKNQDDDLKLSRSVRSHHTKRNSAAGTRSGMGMGASHEGVPASRDFLLPSSNIINNNQSSAYRENVDLNPDLCHKVDGMTYGQQKLCVLHTNIMPAISRGARAAIQECQYQFKNRRWNCSTTEDNTVFGPMSSIGSPEMAFIHALAAATVTSFIARSCRDGQLASCGCSRGARPKQLHDDWTWGGCGDDLEFAYKLSQNFIDIRERERKRGARGLVSVPQKNKLEEKLLLQSSEGVQDSDSIVNGTSTTSMPEQAAGSKLNSSQNRDEAPSPFKPEDLLELQEKITKEILNSKLQEKEMLELKEKINREILNSKVFNFEHHGVIYKERRQHQRGLGQMAPLGRMKNGISAKARSLMNLHNNEAGRRAVIKKTRITCKCHGVSGSCSLITCWQQLSSIREIGDYLREKYDAATEVKLNKRGRLQVKDPRYKVPTAHDLVYLDESPDWCRNNRQLQWPGTHGRVCNKTSSGLDGCAILCCGRGYNTKNIVVQERCNCKFHWCCQVKCEVCVKVLEEHTCK